MFLPLFEYIFSRPLKARVALRTAIESEAFEKPLSNPAHVM